MYVLVFGYWYIGIFYAPPLRLLPIAYIAYCLLPIVYCLCQADAQSGCILPRLDAFGRRMHWAADGIFNMLLVSDKGLSFTLKQHLSDLCQIS